MAQAPSQKELSVFTQAAYSYLFSGYMLQGTEEGIKPGLQTREWRNQEDNI